MNHPQTHRISAPKLEKLIRGIRLKDDVNFLVEQDSSHPFFLIENIEVTETLSLHATYDLPVTFGENCNIKVLEVNENAQLQSIHLKDNATIRTVIVRGNSKIEDLLLHDHSSITDLALFDNCRVDSIRLFESSKVNSIDFYDKSSFDTIDLLGKSYVSELHISSSVSGREINIDKVSSVGTLELTENANLDFLEITGQSSLKEFYLAEKFQLGSIIVSEKAKIGEFNFEGGKIITELQFSNWHSDRLTLQKSSTKFPNKVLLQNVRLNQLQFIDFHVDSSIQIYGLSRFGKQDEAFIELTRSSFNRIEFVANQLESFDFLVFNNSDLTKAFITQTNFPYKITANKNHRDATEVDNQIQSKIFFEQLKTVYLRQGNNTKSLVFHARQLNAYYSLLSWSESFWDKLTLAFNKYSTDFGTKWYRGIEFLIYTTLPLYFLLLISTSHIRIFDWTFSDLSISKVTSNYLTFLTPTTNITTKWEFLYDLEGGSLSGDVQFILFVSKFYIVSVIYQIIQAFRKFGKS